MIASEMNGKEKQGLISIWFDGVTNKKFVNLERKNREVFIQQHVIWNICIQVDFCQNAIFTEINQSK